MWREEHRFIILLQPCASFHDHHVLSRRSAILALYASSQTQQYHTYELEGEGFAVAVLFVGTTAPQKQKRHPSNLPTLRRNKSKQNNNIVPSPVFHF